MWEPLIVNKPDWNKIDYDSLIFGKVPAIILKQFYEKEYCKFISDRILSMPENNFQNEKLTHIGPFLMSYTTKKREYFEQVKIANSKFDFIFGSSQIPTNKIFKMLKVVFPESEITLAHESGDEFSPFIIRIHEMGKSIPLHKDHVNYEGKEYSIANLDGQLSCVLHLQKSEAGGDLIVYRRNWMRSDEKFRKIDFGYSSELTSSEESCKITNIEEGDLVLINPLKYHEVTKIQGPSSRITLGMFLGFSNHNQKNISWA
ncbi:MAG: hypothetical protein ACO2YR_00830 [Nitrosopumilaceae archaeon]